MENAQKLQTEDILKPGETLKSKILDFNDPEVKAMFEAIKKEKKKCLERKKVNWTKLNNTYINV